MLSIASGCGEGAARHDTVRVAVASNFAPTLERIAALFEEDTGIRIEASSGSTGKLYAQIENGAPIDVFLAADDLRPALLIEAGLAREEGRVTYALGRLALYAPGLDLAARGPAVLEQALFEHFAVANPDTAPYGRAALEVLEALGLSERCAGRLVFGENIAQAQQFVESGSAELGLIALSLLAGADPASYWPVPPDMHRPIRQDAVLLERAASKAEARRFLAYLGTESARELIEAAGYGATASAPRATLAGRGRELWPPILLTLRLAATSTLVLLLVGTPLAWWLATSRARVRPGVEALTALPLVLPPTVLGFYLLVLLGPKGPVGAAWEGIGGARLVFSFPGLVIGSVLFSLPFVVQPLQNAFRDIGARPLEVAATLRAAPLDRFFHVVVPLARPAFLTATTLGFAHTVGEFGVVLMIGGNIPGRTQVISIAIYDHVEMLEYGKAHLLSAGMLLFAFLVFFIVYGLNRAFEAPRP